MGFGRVLVVGARWLAALAVVGTFALPMDWIELRVAILGRTKFTWIAAMLELRKPAYGAIELFNWFSLFMAALVLGSFACIAGHPIKAALWNMALLFAMADEAILKPFPGVKIWFVMGYDVCWLGSIAMFVVGLLACGCPAPPKPMANAAAPAAAQAEKAADSEAKKDD